MKALRLALGNLAVLAALLLVCAALGEVFLRAAPERNDVVVRDGREKYRFNPYRPDSFLGWAHRPDWETVHQTDEFSVTVRTGALGLRGAPNDLAGREGTWRVLVLGDSFAFGWGVEDEESFAAQLAVRLAPPPGHQRVEVLNAGVAGWSADHYWIWLQREGLALEPDAVLVAPSENDVSDLAWNRLILDPERLPVRTESTLRMIDRTGRMRYLDSSPLALPSFSFPGQGWLAERSALYHELRYRLARVWLGWSRERVEALHEADYGPAPEGEIPDLGDDEIQRGLLGDRHFQLRYHHFLMAALRSAAEARGARVHTLLVTTRGSAPGDGSVVGALHADCAAHPACVSSEELLAGLPEAERYFPLDGHWTPRAHAAIAEGLLPLLR